MSTVLKEKKKNAIVICIDTWMGGLDGWKDAINEQKLYKINKKNGYPTFYYNFLANVCYAGMQDYIIPLAFPSTIASKILNEVFASLNVKADMIYIDGSHMAEDVYLDCCNYYPLVKPNGLLFGDDYQADDVKQGIKMFIDKDITKTKRLEVFQNQVHWQIRKNE